MVMKNVNVALVRLLQFVIFVVFTFVVLVYFSALLILPLDFAILFIKLLGVFGLNGMISAAIAVPLVGFLGWLVYKTPGLGTLLVNIGMDLVTAGKERVKDFDKIVETVKSA